MVGVCRSKQVKEIRRQREKYVRLAQLRSSLSLVQSGMSLTEDVGEGRNGSISLKMVINMKETQLRTIEWRSSNFSGQRRHRVRDGGQG